VLDFKKVNKNKIKTFIQLVVKEIKYKMSLRAHTLHCDPPVCIKHVINSASQESDKLYTV